MYLILIMDMSVLDLKYISLSFFNFLDLVSLLEKKAFNKSKIESPPHLFL